MQDVQNEEETQEHLLIKCPELNKKQICSEYKDLFGKDVVKLIIVRKHLLKCYKLVLYRKKQP